MPHSLRAKLSGLRYKKIISDKDYDRLCKALDNEDVLDKIRVEIEQKARPNEIGCRGSEKSIRYGLCMALEIMDKYMKEGETETWNGIHVQVTAPKGTFDKIYEECKEDEYDI